MDKTMKRKYLILALIFSLQINVLMAQQHQFTSVEEIWTYALIHNPENSIYQLKIEQAKEDKRNANSYIYPKISAVFSGQKNIKTPETPVPGEILGKPGETVYLKFGQDYSYNTGLTISKSILNWQAKYQNKIAKLTVSYKETEKKHYEQILKEQSAQIYYAALTANQAVAIGNRDMLIADSLLALANDRFDAGLIDALTLNQVKINRNNVSEKLVQSKEYQHQYLQNLKELLGLTATDSVTLTENIGLQKPILPEYALMPDDSYLDLFRLQTDMAGYEVKKSSARFAPKIDYVHYIGGVQYQNDLTLSFKQENWRPNNYIGLSISIPLFTGFSNKAQYKSAKISKSIAEKSYRDEIRKSAIADSVLLNSYLSAAQRVESATKTYQISENSVELTAQKYSQGLIGLDEYLKLFEDYLDAENQYLNRLSEYLIIRATIEARK